MPKYNVTLARAYVVEVRARSRKIAKRMAEYYLDDPKDASEACDRKRFGFSMGEIEMVDNDSIMVEEINRL